MALKKLYCVAALAALVASPVMAQTVRAIPSPVVNANGNRVWTIVATPSAGDLPGSLAAELEFQITNGSAVGTLSVINGSADNTNGGANDTWYYNETSAGSGTLLWNTTAANAADETQNPNPFVAGTFGLQVSGDTASAGLGSTIFAAGTTNINVMQIVTSGGGGILSMSTGNLAQNGGNNNIAAKNFYVPGDFTGDGRANSSDVTALIGAFGQVANFPGFQPVSGTGVAGSGDVTALLGNFGAGTVAPGLSAGSVATPEPSSIAAMISLLGLGAMRRRR